MSTSATQTIESAPSSGTPRPEPTPTMWGLTFLELHDRFWASRGVQVVRCGQEVPVDGGAEQFLLMGADDLAIFRLRPLLDALSWVQPRALILRIRDSRGHSYRETVLTDDQSRLTGFRRRYGEGDARLCRMALTGDMDLVRLWQSATDARSAARLLRRHVRAGKMEVVSIKGKLYNCGIRTEQAQFVRDLMGFWDQPASTIPALRRIAEGVWAHHDAQVASGASFIGPAWIGADRRVEAHDSVLGPAAIWDDPASRVAAEALRWQEIEPMAPRPAVVRTVRSSFYEQSKRIFDICFSLCALALTLPIYPLVMLAIWIEDGRPFFGHVRESRGGQPFRCWKFRSMRKDADRIRRALAEQNQADGPQFFIKHDPRMTWVGRIIRKLNIDELPQFWNVMAGQMSIVGPRPLPYAENQYCPPWREARLDVRPGITGLWQIARTRKPGLDFQEWIRFDLQYIENASWRLDALIIFKTIFVLLRGGT